MQQGAAKMKVERAVLVLFDEFQRWWQDQRDGDALWKSMHKEVMLSADKIEGTGAMFG